ncbi:MotA/TolQ/ExbB proton channel family protein [Myxococcota bacterium]|nr:MotA/TolQ/ExbB proton channel family protein [Myxococcota bacterium]MBU1432929.1 MotA/TolQ/ExbB proton channel family protein [Myxococcota bacterium]
MARLLSLLSGFALFPIAALFSGDLAIFIDLPSILLVTLAPPLIVIGHHGMRGFIRALQVGAGAKPEEESPRVLQSLRDLSCAAGAIGFLIGLVQLLANLDDPTRVGPALAVAMLTVLYGLALAELLYAPILRRLTGPSKPSARGAVTLGAVVLSQGALMALLMVALR